MPLTMASALLPALSLAFPVTPRAAPSPSVVGPEQEATPESASLHAKLTVGAPVLTLYQPVTAGAGVVLPLIVGGVASFLMVTLDVDVPPAEVAEHGKVTPAVSEVTLWGSHPVRELIADSASVTVNETPTFDVYQPLLPSEPVMVGVITGGVVSGAAW